MENFSTWLLFVAIVLILLAIPVLLIWLLGRLVAAAAIRIRRGNPDALVVARRWQLGTYFAAVALLSYQVYMAIYPNDDFFLGEFADVTLREPPTSATVVAKSASYPDLHGDYCSFSRIQLDPAAYAQLLQDLSADTRFKDSDGFLYHEQQAVVRNSTIPIATNRSFAQIGPNHPDRYFSIGFLKDEAHVEVSVCYT